MLAMLEIEAAKEQSRIPRFARNGVNTFLDTGLAFLMPLDIDDLEKRLPCASNEISGEDISFFALGDSIYRADGVIDNTKASFTDVIWGHKVIEEDEKDKLSIPEGGVVENWSIVGATSRRALLPLLQPKKYSKILQTPGNVAVVWGPHGNEARGIIRDESDFERLESIARNKWQKATVEMFRRASDLLSRPYHNTRRLLKIIEQLDQDRKKEFGNKAEPVQTVITTGVPLYKAKSIDFKAADEQSGIASAPSNRRLQLEGHPERQYLAKIVSTAVTRVVARAVRHHLKEKPEAPIVVIPLFGMDKFTPDGHYDEESHRVLAGEILSRAPRMRRLSPLYQSNI